MRPSAHLLAAAALVAFPTVAQAQEEIPTGSVSDDTFTIGLGAAYTPSYEGSDDYILIPGGVLRGRVSRFAFFTRGPQLYADLIREDEGEELDIGFGPVIGVRLNRTTQIEDAQVRALGKLDTAVELGGWVGIGKTRVITSAFDNISFRVAYLRDVANAHDSYIVTPSIEYGTPLSATTYVGISASADYAGDGYAQYYFNVTPAGAAASGLSPFSADGGFKSMTFGLFGNQSLTGNLLGGLSLFAVGTYSKLLGDFKDSPVTSEAGDADQWFGAVGLAYTF